MTVSTVACVAWAAGCSCSDDVKKGGTNDSGNGDGSANPQGDGALTGDGANPGPGPDVNVVITSDNAYGFGYGSPSTLANYFNGIEDNGNDIFACSDACDANTPCATGACDSFGTCNEDRRGPETYVVPGTAAHVGDYLYVVTWSDDSVTQGLVGQFSASDGTNVVRTGSDEWEVCATGVDYDIPGDDPSQGVINEWLGKCNSGEGFSHGWVGTTPNGDNQALVVLQPPLTEPPQFAALCRKPTSSLGDAVDAEAYWIWFDDDVTDGNGAFISTGSPRGEFFIFRLKVDAVISPQ